MPAIIGIMFTDLFDSISTFIGVAHAADLLDEQGHPKNLNRVWWSTPLRPWAPEWRARRRHCLHRERGRNQHGRTHRIDFGVHRALFSALLLLAPLADGSSYATASVLILVGASMFRSVGKILVCEN